MGGGPEAEVLGGGALPRFVRSYRAYLREATVAEFGGALEALAVAGYRVTVDHLTAGRGDFRRDENSVVRSVDVTVEDRGGEAV